MSSHEDIFSLVLKALLCLWFFFAGHHGINFDMVDNTSELGKLVIEGHVTNVVYLVLCLYTSWSLYLIFSTQTQLIFLIKVSLKIRVHVYQIHNSGNL